LSSSGWLQTERLAGLRSTETIYFRQLTHRAWVPRQIARSITYRYVYQSHGDGCMTLSSFSDFCYKAALRFRYDSSSRYNAMPYMKSFFRTLFLFLRIVAVKSRAGRGHSRHVRDVALLPLAGSQRGVRDRRSRSSRTPAGNLPARGHSCPLSTEDGHCFSIFVLQFAAGEHWRLGLSLDSSCSRRSGLHRSAAFCFLDGCTEVIERYTWSPTA